MREWGQVLPYHILGRTHALRGTVKGRARFFASTMRQVIQKGRATAVQGGEIDRFIVGRAMLPTPAEHAAPVEREGPDGSLM